MRFDRPKVEEIIISKAEEVQSLVSAGKADLVGLGFTENAQHPGVMEFYPTSDTLRSWEQTTP